jgi:predicted secreted protein
MKKIIFLILIVLTLSFAGCSGPLTEKDNNKTVEYALDTPFQVQLKGEHSSQYSWKLSSDNKPSVVFKSKEMKTTDNEDIYTFNFLVKSMGEEKIIFVYGDLDEQIKLYEINVVCGTMGRILSE